MACDLIRNATHVTTPEHAERRFGHMLNLPHNSLSSANPGTNARRLVFSTLLWVGLLRIKLLGF